MRSDNPETNVHSFSLIVKFDPPHNGARTGINFENTVNKFREHGD